jgi:hypothetical protein
VLNKELAAGVGGKDKKGTKGAKGAKGGVPTTIDMLGPRWTALQTAAERAHRRGLVSYRKALIKEETYIIRMINSGRFHGKKMLDLEKMLTTLQGQVNAARAAIVARRERAFDDRMSIALAKASLLGGAAGRAKTTALKERIRRHELKIMMAEEKAIRRQITALLKIKKRSEEETHRLAALYTKLAALDKARLALAKKNAADSKRTAGELQAVMDTRGTFFGEFANNVFGAGDGGLTLNVNDKSSGGGGKTVNVHQNNTYNEVPKDRHRQERQGQRAAAGAMA